MTPHDERVKLSLNALLLTPARARWFALRELWFFRSYWRTPHARAAMRQERDRELIEGLPVVMVLALVVGMLIFVVLPAQLTDQSNLLLVTLWPLWVVQVAPMMCAQAMAMQNAPSIALRLTEAHAQGLFAQNAGQRSAQAACMSVPWIMAHVAVGAASACLLVVFSLVFGLLAALVLAVGDLRITIDIIFARVPPLVWLRAGVSAGLLGGVCVLAAVLYAWPGTHTGRSAIDSHRLGLRAMLAASLACAATGIAMNWVAGLLGWNGSVI